MEKNGPEKSKYGAIIQDASINSVVDSMEKPAFSCAQTNFAIIDRYILKPDIFEVLKKQKIDLDVSH